MNKHDYEKVRKIEQRLAEVEQELAAIARQELDKVSRLADGVVLGRRQERKKCSIRRKSCGKS
jgi:hypothetical protein